MTQCIDMMVIRNYAQFATQDIKLAAQYARAPVRFCRNQIACTECWIKECIKDMMDLVDYD